MMQECICHLPIYCSSNTRSVLHIFYFSFFTLHLEQLRPSFKEAIRWWNNCNIFHLKSITSEQQVAVLNAVASNRLVGCVEVHGKYSCRRPGIKQAFSPKVHHIGISKKQTACKPTGTGTHEDNTSAVLLSSCCCGCAVFMCSCPRQFVCSLFFWDASLPTSPTFNPSTQAVKLWSNKNDVVSE